MAWKDGCDLRNEELEGGRALHRGDGSAGAADCVEHGEPDEMSSEQRDGGGGVDWDEYQGHVALVLSAPSSTEDR